MNPEHINKEARRKILWVVIALGAGALEPIVAKFGYRDGLAPLPLFVIRNITAALVLLPFLLRKPPSGASLGQAAITNTISASLLLMTTGFCTLLALNYLTAVTVITVVTTTPAIVALVNQRLGRDVLSKHFWLGFWLCFIGVVMSLEFNSFAASPIGLIAVVIAIFTSSFYRVQMETVTETLNPLVASSLCFAIIGITSLPLLVWVSLPRTNQLPLCIAIGAAAAIANVTFVTAMNKVGSTRLSVIAMAQRPLLIIFAAIVLREQPTLLQLVGIVLVMVGMHFAKVRRVEASGAEARLQVAQTGL